MKKSDERYKQFCEFLHDSGQPGECIYSEEFKGTDELVIDGAISITKLKKFFEGLD